MSATSPLEQYAASAASAIVDDISERVRQLAKKIKDLQQISQSQSALLAAEERKELRKRIEHYYREIFLLEEEKAHTRHRNSNYLSVVMTVVSAVK